MSLPHNKMPYRLQTGYHVDFINNKKQEEEGSENNELSGKAEGCQVNLG